MKKVNNLFNAGYGWGRTYPLKTRLKTILKEEPIDYNKEYMYVEALEDGLTVSFTKSSPSGSLYYSLDKQEWNELSGSQTINSGEKIYFKGDLVPASYNGITAGIGAFTINKQCNVAGNVMSLLFADDFVGKTDLTGYNYAFYSLFGSCKMLQSAENLILPATILEEKCYRQMFFNCTGLTTAPKLPATTLADECYQNMFQLCTGLITAPELPATTLAEYCYAFMFRDCSSLTTAPKLPATTLERDCYQYMFYNCTSLTSAPELPAITLAVECYYYMFYNCTSLNTAPELPATTLADRCYQNMFSGCTNLNYIKMLATDISASSCLYNWVNGVAATGTFVKANGVEIPTGESGIPEGWTVQTA